MVEGALFPVEDNHVRKDSTVSYERGLWAEERKIWNLFQQDWYCLLEVGRKALSINATESSKNFLHNPFRRKSTCEDSETSAKESSASVKISYERARRESDLTVPCLLKQEKAVELSKSNLIDVPLGVGNLSSHFLTTCSSL
ncbi:hypothetical protein Pmani_024569 [Petrolisthes manimaculis]|uniref:Uncharacterized protein n=1 Tax=Petrolisthes manimaculis TaxID=1843537 RepID=A0AAE1P784_9EUCA|nr:hypothetical protein Pmani_024569 [Petrolisthes manimaculis]